MVTDWWPLSENYVLARISRQLSSVQSDPSHTAKTIAENSKKNDDNKQEIVKYLQWQMDKR